jgi:hypothetical protein
MLFQTTHAERRPAAPEGGHRGSRSNLLKPHSSNRRAAAAARLLGAIVFIFSLPVARALESTWVYAVQATATVHHDPLRVEIHWPADHLPVAQYAVGRKQVGDREWGGNVVLDGHATSFTDFAVERGRRYEYRIVKQGVGYNGYGYVCAAIEAPLVDDRGTVILVVDASVAGDLEPDLLQFQQDLVGDGWTVVRRDVERTARPADVKAQIKAVYDADPDRARALILFGHVPVVRSGNLNVDGHAARPLPADVYYAELTGTWTDQEGDGIYDQSHLPSDTELEVGRIDFANLPGRYGVTPYPGEVELLRSYLRKNRAYRHRIVRSAERALIGNSIGDGGGQAYAAIGYRNFPALLGPDRIVTAGTDADSPPETRWIALLARDDYLFVYGNGGGSDFSAANLGFHGQYRDVLSTDFLDGGARGTFYLLFGSWFVDWARPDNLLRSALVPADYGLGAAWAGRPHLFLHHLAIGEAVGYGMRVSQNNDGHYQNHQQRQLRGIHLAWMGDPTLRLHVIAPPSDVTAVATEGGVLVSWQPSRDDVPGYHVYRADSAGAPFVRLTEVPTAANSLLDAGSVPAGASYQVRAVVLQNGPGGSYYNASQGAFAAHAPAPEASPAADVVWWDDALPPGAIAYSMDNDSWTWVSDHPRPFSGALAHQSESSPGLHFHFFAFAREPLAIGASDVLFAHVYLDPGNPPRTVMLTWCTDTWEHRAYWGENLIGEGVDGSSGRRYMGPLPPAGRWIRLEVPASAVGLEGRHVHGMGFNLYDGRAAWDRAGKTTR